MQGRRAFGASRSTITSHRQRAPRRRKLRLFVALVAVHVVAVGGATVALIEKPREVAGLAEGAVEAAEKAAEKAAEGAAERLVDQAAGRPYLRPAKAPAGSGISPVPQHGSGRFAVAPVHAHKAPQPGALTYRVEVERGLPYDAAGFANTVARTLADPKGWTADPGHRFARVEGEADFRIVLASPDTVDRLCAPLDTLGRVSCRNGDDVVINAWRWWRGAKSYGNDVATYRTYVINHETGHFLGYGHVGCPGAGKPAPVMHQQTLGLNGCKANPWPTAAELN